MRGVLGSVLAVITTVGVIGYAGGFFTKESRAERSCVLCRAVEYHGRTYGFRYTQVEDSVVTRWYRENIDPQHGLDPAHPHTWFRSDCSPSGGDARQSRELDCMRMPAVFLLRPEVELAILQKIPDKATQAGLIRAVNSASFRQNLQRVSLLVEYYHVHMDRVPWQVWWKHYAGHFGL